MQVFVTAIVALIAGGFPAYAQVETVEVRVFSFEGVYVDATSLQYRMTMTWPSNIVDKAWLRFKGFQVPGQVYCGYVSDWGWSYNASMHQEGVENPEFRIMDRGFYSANPVIDETKAFNYAHTYWPFTQGEQIDLYLNLWVRENNDCDWMQLPGGVELTEVTLVMEMNPSVAVEATTWSAIKSMYR